MLRREWAEDHVLSHIQSVEDEHYGRVTSMEEGTLIVADADGLEAAGARADLVEVVSSAARELAAAEFDEDCSARMGSGAGHVYLAIDGMSFEFRGYIAVTPRDCVYGDGTTEHEHHIESVAVVDSHRKQGIGAELIEEAIGIATDAGASATLWCVKGLRYLYAQWCFYDAEPPADPDYRPSDCIFMRFDS